MFCDHRKFIAARLGSPCRAHFNAEDAARVKTRRSSQAALERGRWKGKLWSGVNHALPRPLQWKKRASSPVALIVAGHLRGRRFSPPVFLLTNGSSAGGRRPVSAASPAITCSAFRQAKVRGLRSVFALKVIGSHNSRVSIHWHYRHFRSIFKASRVH